MNIKTLGAIILGAVITGAAPAVQAKKMSDLKVYINPGHGGYTSNDRPIQIYPFAPNDSNGYWESKSNLYKGLHMYHILDSLGAKPYLSRTKNTEADDRSLSGIAAEANQLGCDLFFSIHSNAGEDVNYPLMLYRENTIGTPRYPGNVTLSKILWNNLHSSKLAVWTRDQEYVEGDLTFYRNMWEGGLGVLRTLYVVGLLSEGGMHEHRPEAHRLMNNDYWWLEAWHFVRAIMEYENTEDRFVTGNVAGIVYDNHNLREKDMPVNFHYYGRDQYAPLNFAQVVLKDKQGNVVQTRTTDDMHNGVYVFRNVAPGDYTVTATRDDYYTETTPVTVTANEVTYQDMPLVMRRPFPLQITTYSPASTEPVSCASTIDFTFNTDVDTESFEKAFSIDPPVDGYWVYSDTYRKASYVPTLSLDLNTHYTVTVGTGAKTPDTYYTHPGMEQELKFEFDTKGRNRLELIDQFPAHQGTVHCIAPSLELRFDKSIDYSNIYDMVTLTDSKGNALTFNKRTSKYNQLSNGYGNAVLTVQGNLNEGETYRVKLSGELRDRETLPLVNDIEFDFTATDVTKDGQDQQVILDFENTCDFAYDAANTKGIGTVLPGAIRSTASKLYGNAGGKFSYQFTDNHGGEIVWNYTGEPRPFNPGDKIGMFVNGDFNNHEVWVGFTSGTNKKYTKLTDLDYLGWQYREATLDNLDKEFAPFLLSDIKLVQAASPVTQKGNFSVDNIGFKSAAGVSEITVGDNALSVTGAQGALVVKGATANAAVRVYSMDGRLVAGATGNAVVALNPGLYLVTVNNTAVRVTVD